MKKLIVLFLYAAISLANANDCIPLAFAHLSKNIDNPVSYETWVDELQTKKGPPSLEESIKAWNSRFSDRNFICIYSTNAAIESTEKEIIPYPFGKPYLWIGEIPDRLKNGKTKANSHAALLSVVDDQKFILVHPLNPESTEFFIEQLSQEQFFKRTYVVYQLEKNE